MNFYIHTHIQAKSLKLNEFSSDHNLIHNNFLFINSIDNSRYCVAQLFTVTDQYLIWINYDDDDDDERKSKVVDGLYL